MPRDSILLGDFNSNTQWGLHNFCQDLDGHAARLDSGTPEVWAYLWFQLRAAKDNLRWFPSGKWATVQHLEGMLNECAKGADHAD